jgi:glyoxylase-like metal-dependent hydrolase (beta-lactamase superfamily II)
MLKKIVILSLSTVCTFAFNYDLKPQKVSEDVWCFFGKLEPPTKENAGFMSNSCYIKTTDSYVLIESGASYGFAKQAYEAMQKIQKLPVNNIIITHVHDDHWLGNNFYKEKFNAKIYAPALLNKEYNENSDIRGLHVLTDDEKKGTKFIPSDEIINEIRNSRVEKKSIDL